MDFSDSEEDRMLNQLRNKLHWIAPVLLALTLFALPASALDLAQAKSQGLVKETSTGYLTAVKPSAEVNSLVQKINAGRKAAYQKLANDTGAPLSAVEQRAGEKLTR